MIWTSPTSGSLTILPFAALMIPIIARTKTANDPNSHTNQPKIGMIATTLSATSAMNNTQPWLAWNFANGDFGAASSGTINKIPMYAKMP